jgi:hypothetical protein
MPFRGGVGSFHVGQAESLPNAALQLGSWHRIERPPDTDPLVVGVVAGLVHDEAKGATAGSLAVHLEHI